MTILIGLAPGQRDEAAVHVGSMLARSSGEDVIVLAVVPAPWPPDPYQADKEFLAFQEARAQAALTRARDYLRAGSLDVECLLVRAESVPAGLLQVIEERQVSSVALGSSSSGLLGRVMLGGVAERILHASERPVIIAPRAFHQPGAARFARLSVAVGRADHDGGLVAQAASMAHRMDTPLRVVCFAVRPLAEYAAALEPGTEHLVVHEWMKRLEEDIVASLASATQRSGRAEGSPGTTAEMVVGQGGSWAEALHDIVWSDGDLLVVGTSNGPLSRLYLGSHAAKIVRNSPVPVLLMPRGHTRAS
jgi:nucleotide-binding universal stress UspA family protein